MARRGLLITTALVMLCLFAATTVYVAAEEAAKKETANTGAGDAQSVPSEDIYRHKSNTNGTHGAKNIKVEMETVGEYTITRRGDNATIPIVMGILVIDAPGSSNMLIVINKNVGYTDYAGLRFKQEVTVNIWEDGIVEVDKEGIEVSDKKGANWISKKVKMENGKVAIVMVRKR